MLTLAQGKLDISGWTPRNAIFTPHGVMLLVSLSCSFQLVLLP